MFANISFNCAENNQYSVVVKFYNPGYDGGIAVYRTEMSDLWTTIWSDLISLVSEDQLSNKQVGIMMEALRELINLHGWETYIDTKAFDDGKSHFAHELVKVRPRRVLGTNRDVLSLSRLESLVVMVELK
jgi:hypothetical protein